MTPKISCGGLGMSSIDDLPPPDHLNGPTGGIDDLPPPDMLQSRAPRGVKVSDEPFGPEQPGTLDRIKERIQDPNRWKAILSNTGPYAKDVVAGAPPMAVPAGALGAIGKGLVALGEGQGLGYAAGRTALASGQGALMSGMGGKDGETAQDKIDRMQSGAQLS